MNNTRKQKTITNKMASVYSAIKEVFSPISLILDEDIIGIDGVVVIKPKLTYVFEKESYAFALRTLYGGSGVGINDYDSKYAIYFYIKNSCLKGGIFNLQLKKRVTDIIEIEELNDTDNEYINAYKMEAINRIKSFLLE